MEKVRGFVEDAGWTVVGEMVSPILGGSGNKEFSDRRAPWSLRSGSRGSARKATAWPTAPMAILFVPFALAGERVKVEASPAATARS